MLTTKGAIKRKSARSEMFSNKTFLNGGTKPKEKMKMLLFFSGTCVLKPHL